MEDGLRVCEKKTIIIDCVIVLILVVMEDGLRVCSVLLDLLHKLSLNPCCYGRWSQRTSSSSLTEQRQEQVLILVVMEDGLREFFRS